MYSRRSVVTFCSTRLSAAQIKDETEEERKLRLEMEALAAEESERRAQVRPSKQVGTGTPQRASCSQLSHMHAEPTSMQYSSEWWRVHVGTVRRVTLR